ncbi:low temperature requirement protein A [Phytohabitans sp. ZYX-F-186]|uniref:Low temperature requirement protein A n=1 Tax=Phytohabitans maris TaxID=3071409 RepID=A0ABU0ZVM2_9ACTN|nr:low temperature requirement protein A [Phytohabitans sp. ZYX-F-186]MDQ7911037.1 low temperature requirement protein A [Phytohabitans sp. ZYX-F-186]
MTHTPARRPWYRPMVARRPDEPHRASTPLELFFDLCFVVAVAQAAAQLHHDVAEDHIGHAVPSYLMVFFAIWWAWMNFTWFASAYDTDDDLYRITTLVQVTGALVLAAGVPRAFADADFSVITYGYVLMRLAMVAQWLRVARTDVHPGRRACGRRYAIGIALVQVGWVLRLALPDDLLVPGFLVLVLAELAVPIWAERVAETTWHPEHIAERYGLFTIIVLGESILAAGIAVQSAVDEHKELAGLLWGAGAGIVIVFGMWWLYFDRPAGGLLTSMRVALFWGYGHYLIFASAAAVGAGLSVAVDHEIHEAHLGGVAVGYAVAVPVALYLSSVWLLHVRPHQHGLIVAAYPVAAVLALLAPLTPAPVPAVALLVAALVAVTVAAAHLENRPAVGSTP